MQSAAPGELEICPATHAVHAEILVFPEVLEYLPAIHAVGGWAVELESYTLQNAPTPAPHAGGPFVPVQ